MKKNKLTKILMACVVCGTVVLNFSPVFATNSYWSAQPISDFLSNKIDAPTVLKDEKYTTYITREEFSQLIVGLYAKSNNLDKESIQTKENPFTDTTNIDVQRAYSLGIIQGIDKNTFNPNNNITREQIATILTRFLNIKKLNTNSANNLNSFTDKNDISNWAFDSLAYCVDNQIIKGFQNKLQPKMTTTVEEAITMLDRIAIKNNWIIKSNDMYACGFLLPNDTKITFEIYGNNVFALNIRWNNIDDIEKLKKDLTYMLNSKVQENDNKINEIIDAVIKSKEVDLKYSDDEFRKTININKYQLEIIGSKEVTYIYFNPINQI